MANEVNVKIKLINSAGNGLTGNVLSIVNPLGSSVQSATTDAGGCALFTSISENTYSVTRSGATVMTNYQVKNTYIPDPSQSSNEHRTFIRSKESFPAASGVIVQNNLLNVASGIGAIMAPNTTSSYTGDVVTGGATPQFYNEYTNQIVFWSGTNVTKQPNTYYINRTQNTTFTQFAQIKLMV